MKKFLFVFVAGALFVTPLLSGCCSSREVGKADVTNQAVTEQTGTERAEKSSPRRGVPPEHCRITAVVDTLFLKDTFNGMRQYVVLLKVESVNGIGHSFMGDVHAGVTVKTMYRSSGAALRFHPGERVAAEIKSSQFTDRRRRQYILVSIETATN